MLYDATVKFSNVASYHRFYKIKFLSMFEDQIGRLSILPTLVKPLTILL